MMNYVKKNNYHSGSMRCLNKIYHSFELLFEIDGRNVFECILVRICFRFAVAK